MVFGGVYAEAWDPAAAVDDAVSGFTSCDIFPFSPVKLTDCLFSSGIIYSHS
jgi:hypothetical protein